MQQPIKDLTKEEQAKEYSKQFSHQVSFEGLQNIETDFIAGYCAAMSTLQQAKDAAFKWISVSESLPELNSYVMVIDAFDHIEFANYCIDKTWLRGNEPGFLNMQDEQPSCCLPTHWSYPPKVPYREKGGEDEQ